MGCISSRGATNVGHPRRVSLEDEELGIAPVVEPKAQLIAKHLGSAPDSPDFCPQGSLADVQASSLRLILNLRRGGSGRRRSKQATLEYACSYVRRASLDSQAMFADKAQTIIIFDWDDTLCPSTWLHQLDYSLPSENAGAAKKLESLAHKVVNLLSLASVLGQVVIVTNAKRPWVKTMCNRHMPGLKEILEQITVIYALEGVRMPNPVPQDPEAFKRVFTTTKVQAMRNAVTSFYSRYPNQSWKNIVSVGDAWFEHNAVRQVAQERPAHTSGKLCRTKVVKLVSAPAIELVEKEVQLLTLLMLKIVEKDGDVYIDFDDDETSFDKMVHEFKTDLPVTPQSSQESTSVGLHSFTSETCAKSQLDSVES